MPRTSHNDYVRQRMDSYFAQRNMQQHFKRQNDRISQQRTRSYSSTSSSSSDDSYSPDIPDFRALEREIEERNQRLYDSINSSTPFSLTKLFCCCFAGK